MRILALFLFMLSGAAWGNVVSYSGTVLAANGLLLNFSSCDNYATSPTPGLLVHYKANQGDVYQDTGCSTAVTADGNPVACVTDLAGTLANADMSDPAGGWTWEEAYLNGKDAVAGDNTGNIKMSSGTTSASGYTDITIVAELEGADAGQFYDIYDAGFAQDMYLQAASDTTNMSLDFGTSSGIQLSSGNYADGTDLLVVVTWSFDDQTGAMRINGTEVDSDVTTGSSEDFVPHLISGLGERFGWTETMIYDGLLSASEITILEGCMGY
jgi:hypothetical protein